MESWLLEEGPTWPESRAWREQRAGLSGWWAGLGGRSFEDGAWEDRTAPLKHSDILGCS